MTDELAHQTNAWAEEERRQSQIDAAAIDKAIRETSRQFATPILNAVAGALVTATAGVLDSVDSPPHRKELRKAMDRTLPLAVAHAIADGTRKSETLVIGGTRQ